MKTRKTTASEARERLARLGAEGLSTRELLELVGGRGVTALSDEVLSLASMAKMSIDQLRAVGAAPTTAASVCAAFELCRRVAQEATPTGTLVASAAAAYEFLRPRMAHLDHEAFVVVLLDIRLRVLRDVRVADGTSWACAVHPRDVLTPALREGAAAVLFAHNHPSGDATPSAEDKDLTHRLVRACTVVGVRAVDHLVVADQGYSSFRELGLFVA